MQIGSVVSKKSGGYIMTVEKIENNIALCVYFNENNLCERREVEVDQLNEWTRA